MAVGNGIVVASDHVVQMALSACERLHHGEWISIGYLRQQLAEWPCRRATRTEPQSECSTIAHTSKHKGWFGNTFWRSTRPTHVLFSDGFVLHTIAESLHCPMPASVSALDSPIIVFMLQCVCVCVCVCMLTSHCIM